MSAEQPPGRPGYSLRKDYLLWALVGLLLLCSLLQPGKILSYPSRVDWDTIAMLLGLLMLATGVEWSGYLYRLGTRLTQRLHDQRRLALFLVIASALLSMALTNDIALFIVVPLSLGLHGVATLPIRRLVVFEALAVNAGSMLTPIGNPQNIFLWERSGVHFFQFVWHMLPPVLVVSVSLLLLTCIAFPPQFIDVKADAPTPALRPRLLQFSLGLFPLFLLLADLHRIQWALGLVAVVFLLGFRDVLRRLDWPLLAVFVLMFVDMSLVAELPGVRDGVGRLDPSQPLHLYIGSALLSQLISNVPATLLMSKYSSDWQTLAWGANLGGFGCVVGSLANLIALRLGRQSGSFKDFHAWSLPFFALTVLCVGIWLAA